MAVDILQLVSFHIKPALTADATLVEDLPILIAAQKALQGWPEPLTDKQSVYVAAVTLEALMPRLALIFNDEVQERRAGVETTRMPNRAEFFRVLQNAITAMKNTAAQEAGISALTPAAVSEQILTPWPGVGIAPWR